VRKVVRKQRKQAARQERQFLTPASTLPLAPAPVPLTFNLPPPPAPAPVRVAPAPIVAPAPLRVAPAPVVAPFRASPIVPFVHHQIAAPAPAIRIAPLPFAQPAVHVSHIHHAPVAPVPAPALAPLPAPAPAPVVAPAPAVEIVEVREVPLEYGAPSTVAPEVRNNYLAPAVEEARDVETGYLSPAVEVEAVRAEPGYLSPVVEEAPVESAPAPVVEVEAARDVDTGYLAPRDSYIAVPAEPVVEAKSTYIAAEPVVEAKNTYIAAALPSVRQEEYVPNVAANVRATAKPKQIAIIRNILNPPTADPAFDYSFESENGIKQEAVGTMRRVDDSDVAVMKGSYSYVGADGQVYTVDWYADETGFHPSAPHLPQPVAPNHPEVAAAVRAQLEFAAQEDAAAAASRTSTSYLAPEELPGYNY